MYPISVPIFFRIVGVYAEIPDRISDFKAPCQTTDRFFFWHGNLLWKVGPIIINNIIINLRLEQFHWLRVWRVNLSYIQSYSKTIRGNSWVARSITIYALKILFLLISAAHEANYYRNRIKQKKIIRLL